MLGIEWMLQCLWLPEHFDPVQNSLEPPSARNSGFSSDSICAEISLISFASAHPVYLCRHRIICKGISPRMNIRLSDLYNLKGKIGRIEYVFWGILLSAIKYGIDRTVAQIYFQKDWPIWRYFMPVDSGTILKVSASDRTFFFTLILIALPFIVSGVALTVRRLRDVQAPEWLALGFFVPILNLILFLILALLPSSKQPVRVMSAPRQSGSWIPQSKTGSILAAILLNLLSGLLFARFSVKTVSQYGWGLFVGLPFSIGFTSVMIYSYHERRTLRECLGIAFASLSVLFLALLVFAYEGVICLVMAFPICVPIGLLGGCLGYVIQFHPETRGATYKFCSIAILVVPLIMAGEKKFSPEAKVFSTTSSIEIDAPVQEVWKHVIEFAEIPEPREWYFRAGFAYPIRARIDGSGAGAIRHCIFSTGEFTEPIVIWNEPHLLQFKVTANPEPMKELTFYSHLRPPHLNGFFVSHQGQFELIEISPNRTLLKGTTWYQHHMSPERYWRYWSDWMIHRIHMRVLFHIRNQTEVESQKESRRSSF
jgi:uncharacterized membrane protein YhaH (DUF805 family)